MKCPHCNIEMGTTYEPYEYRCGKCGYWFDTWTGKEVTFAPPADEEDYDDSPCHQWEEIWDDGVGCRCCVCMVCNEHRIFEYATEDES